MKLIKKLIHRALGIEVVSALRQPQADREHAVRTVKPKDGSTFLAQHPSLWDDVLAMADRCIKAVRKLWTIPPAKRVSQEEMAAVFARHTETAAQVGYDLMKQGHRERLRYEVHADLIDRKTQADLAELNKMVVDLPQLDVQAEIERMIRGTGECIGGLPSDQMLKVLEQIRECKSITRAQQLWDRALATYVPENTDPHLKEIMQGVADSRLRQFAAEDAAAAQHKKPVIRWCPILKRWSVRGPDYQTIACAIKLNLLNQKGKR